MSVRIPEGKTIFRMKFEGKDYSEDFYVDHIHNEMVVYVEVSTGVVRQVEYRVFIRDVYVPMPPVLRVPALREAFEYLKQLGNGASDDKFFKSIYEVRFRKDNRIVLEEVDSFGRSASYGIEDICELFVALNESYEDFLKGVQQHV